MLLLSTTLRENVVLRAKKTDASTAITMSATIADLKCLFWRIFVNALNAFVPSAEKVSVQLYI